MRNAFNSFLFFVGGAMCLMLDVLTWKTGDFLGALAYLLNVARDNGAEYFTTGSPMRLVLMLGFVVCLVLSWLSARRIRPDIVVEEMKESP